jgi:hypothetical protein
MDSIFFIVVLGCLVLVAGWYLGNEATRSAGDWGFLAIRPPSDMAKTGGLRYRAKARVVAAPDRKAGSAAESAVKKGAHRFKEKPRGRFRDKDETGYRARKPLGRLKGDAGEEPS